MWVFVALTVESDDVRIPTGAERPGRQAESGGHDRARRHGDSPSSRRATGGIQPAELETLQRRREAADAYRRAR